MSDAFLHPQIARFKALSVGRGELVDLRHLIPGVDVPVIVRHPVRATAHLIVLCIERDLDQILQRDVLGSEAVFICPDAGAVSRITRRLDRGYFEGKLLSKQGCGCQQREEGQ